MGEKKPKPVVDLASIVDLESMRAAQGRLDWQQRALAGSAISRTVQRELDKVLKLERQMRFPLAEQVERLMALDHLVAPGAEMAEQLRVWEEVLRPYPEAWRAVTDQASEVQRAIDAVMRPFDQPVMRTLLDGLIPDSRLDEYLGLFDFGKLGGFIEQHGEKAEPDEEGEGEPEGAVEFESSIQIQMISAISDALIEHFQRHPEEMRTIKPRLFEELVAKLLAGMGFEVELTQQTRDGGYDIVAVQHGLSATRHLVECKRYAEGRPVSVREVRALYGVVTGEDASTGIMVTTSRLSRDASVVVESHRSRLGKAEFEDLKRWILEYLKPRSARGPAPPG